MKHYRDIISSIEDKGLNRELRAIESLADGYCRFNGNKLVNFSSNDYLGILDNEQINHSFWKELQNRSDWKIMGAGSSRLLTGNTSLYDETEALLAKLYEAQSAIFFNSGYHANVGILSALTEKKDLILSDKLCHASIIDGIRLSSADHIRYRHLDYAQIETLLEQKRHLYRSVFIVTESVFSMDGDEANLQKLVSIKEKYDVYLYVDEAHAVGVKGEKGLGSCEEQNVINRIDILVGTMGKALASVGAYAVFSQLFRKVLVNKARTLLFTTALPSINMAWSKHVIEQIPTLHTQRKKLNDLSLLMSKSFTELGYDAHHSHIIPLIVGSNEAAVQLSLHLQQKGFLVFPIRPPTVPVNTSRLRFSLTSSIKEEYIHQLVQVIKESKAKA